MISHSSGVRMMYIAARERKILELLLMKSEETTVKEISSELDVSPRTVHRDLKGVEDILTEHGLQLVKKSGIGIQVSGDKAGKEHLQQLLFTLSHQEYTPEERQTLILSSLLETKDPVKLIALAHDLNVTIATISNDLNKIEEQVTPFGLSLVRKRGYGVEIQGPESAKRKAMSKLIITNIDEFEFITILKETIQKKASQTIDTVTDRLLGLVEKQKLLMIERQIDSIKSDLPYSIADSAYIGLVVHLALAIERIQQGEEITFDHDYLQTLKKTKEYHAAEKIVAGLESLFSINISEGELGYITMHLMGAKLRNEHDDMLEDSSLHVGLLAQQLIRFVSQELDYDLQDNVSLFHGLVAHLKPALHRIKQNMGISNPLLSKIESDYHDMFVVLEKGVSEVFPELHVPKEEIGYLVLHFASAILNKEDKMNYRTLVVCSSGIGTSKMLSTKLQQAIQGITTVNASLFDLENVDVHDFDAVISTIPLKNFQHEYLVVSPLLAEEEIEKVKRLLKNRQLVQPRKKQRTNRAGQRATDRDFIEYVEKIKNYSTAIYSLLAQFNVRKLEMVSTVELALQMLCEPLEEKQTINSQEQVVTELLRREQIGGLGIPNTSLALYHTKSESVQTPTFSVGHLEEPLQVKAMDGDDLSMHTILLLLSPLNSNEETNEMLSAISALVIRDEPTIRFFETGTEQEVKTLLVEELSSFFKKKI